MQDGELYDVVGVGFGPANMALAVAMEEYGEDLGGGDLRRLFLDAKPSPAWHPSLMLEGSMLQITALKDLITVVDPCSRFTFLNYLKEKGRLFDFLNLRDLFPTRCEFNDYLVWAAGKLESYVRFGRRVRTVEPVEGGDGGVELLRVVSQRADGRGEETVLARNLVLATGPTPCVPPGIELTPGGRAFHAHEFLPRMERDFADTTKSYRFIVVGSGQTGAELFDYLMRCYPNADVTAAIRRFSYRPVDESDFTNRIFHPEWVDFYYNLPEEKRQAFFESLKDVNYAAVDHPLIKRIYRRLYDERVQGKQRARVLPFKELTRVRDTGSEVEAQFRDVMSEEASSLEADALIVASGYSWSTRQPALAELAPYFETEEDGEYRVLRDYRIATVEGFTPRVYLQSYNERTHGIGETVLSLIPVRAGDILRSLCSGLEGRPEPTKRQLSPEAVGAAGG